MMKENRGNKLKTENEEIFSAQVYSGKEAVGMGLVDNLGSITQVMCEKFPGAQL